MKSPPCDTRLPSNTRLPLDTRLSSIERAQANMLPPEARKKMQSWIRSRHLVCSGNFYIFETVDSSAVDRFTDCVTALQGTLIAVEQVDKIWIGDHRQVVLYRARATLHVPCHTLRQYWIKYGSFRTRFNPQS